jgi:hypothetical protein
LGDGEHWLGMAEADGDGVHVGAHHSHDRGTERTGPRSGGSERPNCAARHKYQDDNKNDAAHTADGTQESHSAAI